jgi:hypothetical protein
MRRRWNLLAGMGVLAVLFLSWYAVYGRSSGFTDIAKIPGFLAGLAAYTLTGSLGLWPLYHLSHGALIVAGAILFAVIIVVAIQGTRRGWWSAHNDASVSRVAGLLLMLSSYWVLVAVSRSGLTPYRSRYMEPGAIVLVLHAAELLPRRLPARTVTTLVIGCALIVVMGVPYLVHNASKYRLESETLSAELGTLERAHNVPPGFQPAPSTDPQIRAALLARAERALSSHVGASAETISRMPRSAQDAAAGVQRALVDAAH